MKKSFLSFGNNMFIRLKVPTLLGLSLIIIGIIVGVFLTLQEQTIISKASPDVTAQDITLSNLTDTEATISWQTSTPATSFITFGQTNPSEQTVLEDKDTPSGKPKAHLIHYVTIKNLLPKTTYQYKIVTGKISSEGKFTTTGPISAQLGFRPIIGSVLDREKSPADSLSKPLEEGLVYLSITDATTLSAQVKSGNFLIPLSQIRTADLSDVYPLSADTIAKLTIVSENGTVSVLFKLKSSDKPLPPLKLGQNIDLTNEPTIEPSPPSTQELSIYDLNGDGKINAADNAIIILNFGKNPKDEKGSTLSKKADLNKDGVVDQKDLDLMSKQINQ